MKKVIEVFEASLYEEVKILEDPSVPAVGECSMMEFETYEEAEAHIKAELSKDNSPYTAGNVIKTFKREA